VHEERLLEELENISKTEKANDKQQNKPPLPGKNGQINKNKAFSSIPKAKPIKIQSSEQFMKDLDTSSFIDKKQKSLILTQNNFARGKETFTDAEWS